MKKRIVEREPRVREYLVSCHARDKELGLDKTLTKVKRELSKSPEGKALLQFLKEHDIPIVFYQNPEKLRVEDKGRVSVTMAFYTPNYSAIFLSPCDDVNQLVSLLAHEARHAWQDVVGLIPRGDISAKEFIIHRRFLEADAYATQGKVCWDLKGKNYWDNPWYSFESIAPSLAWAFEGAIEKLSNKNETSEQAQRAAFDKFFFSGIRDFYDQNLLSVFRNILSGKDEGLLSFIQKPSVAYEPASTTRGVLDPEILKLFGQRLTGGNYLVDVPGKPLDHKQYFNKMAVGTRMSLARTTLKAAWQIVRGKGHKAPSIKKPPIGPYLLS